MNSRDASVPAHDEQTLEQLLIDKGLIDKGLIAPRITPERIDALIVSEQYHVFDGAFGEGPRFTACLLTLSNGYQVLGESSCVDHRNFDADVGRSIARKNARDKIWALEGYLLREQLASNVGAAVGA